MAILSKIRQRTVFLIVIIAMALFAFVLADVIKNGGGTSSKSQSRMGTVNDTEISREEFTKKVEQAQQRNPNLNGNAAVNQVWNAEVRSALMKEEYEKLGLRVEQAQINDALALGLANSPQFQNELGEFDEIAMQEYIQNALEQEKNGNPTTINAWRDYESSTELQILSTMYYNLIKGGLKSTLAEGEQQYRFENDKVDIQFVRVPYTAIADDEVAVSESEISDYIAAHPKDFEVDAQTDIEYVLFEENPSVADIEAAKQNLAVLNTARKERGETIVAFKDAEDAAVYVNEYSDNSYVDKWYFKNEIPAGLTINPDSLLVGDVYGPYQNDNNFNLTKVITKRQMPDSVQSKHILVRWAGTLRASSDITRTEEEAKAKADSLFAVVKRAPSKFDDLAKEFSDDTSNNEKGGDLGYFGPGRLAPAFNDYIFDNKKGSIGLVKTDFGYHIISVTDQKNIQDVYKLATITKEIEASDATINKVFSDASKFEQAAKSGDLSELAKAQNLEVRPVNKMGVLDANVTGIPNSRTMITWSHDEETNVGDVKRFTIDNGYAIARVTRKAKEGLMSVADASAQVMPKLRNKKKAAMLKEKMSGDDLNSIASTNSVTVQNASALTMASPTIPGAGAEPKVVGTAFALEAGATTGTIIGNTGVFKVKVTAKNPATALDNYASFANQLNSANTAVEGKIYNAIKNAAEIDDNRATFY